MIAVLRYASAFAVLTAATDSMCNNTTRVSLVDNTKLSKEQVHAKQPANDNGLFSW